MKYFASTVSLIVAVCASMADAQTFTTLLQFSGTGGASSGQTPTGGLTLSGTALYGTTQNGGANGDGNIFSVGTAGTNYQNLLSFTGTGGAASGGNPRGNLTLAGTSLYGMTIYGGAGGYGNIFSLGTDGTNYQNLIPFTGTGGSASGWEPEGSLTPSGGTLFGMTSAGGDNAYGNIFSAGTDGTNYRNIISFNGSGGSTSGYYPSGGLTLSGTTLYGATIAGGNGGNGKGKGIIFSVGTDGTGYRVLLSFTGTGGSASGSSPEGNLSLCGTTLYGMTFSGGADNDGVIFSLGTDGTNYQNVLSFTGVGGSAIGQYPQGSLTLSGTTLYGMTSAGGADGHGNIFSVGTNGLDYQNLYSFTNGTDGDYPIGDLTLSGGTLFGMADGGAQGGGTVFALTLPAPTPEPGTLALVGCGAAAVVTYRWRRRRREGRKANDVQG